uniref:ESAT-6-like protein n=1 Tax=Thermogemmatispora argillosa TaxID=2045280 RepID=A0A455SW70_9CHLR|nr:hypothetical protein KTA_08720 [Thermogemmatispora argillosa]
MPEKISYPVAEMLRTAREIRQVLDQQWDLHCQHFSGAPDSYLELTRSWSCLVPGGDSLVVKLQQWHQQVRACYEALYALASLLEEGVSRMNSLDDELARDFEPR